MQNSIKFTIPLDPKTKKNSQQIMTNWATGKPFISQSDVYKQYEKDCKYFLKSLSIGEPINIKALYFRKTKRRVDLSNLNSALHDILITHNVIEDDNCNIVVSSDGSRVFYDKENPRTEVEISFLLPFADLE